MWWKLGRVVLTTSSVAWAKSPWIILNFELILNRGVVGRKGLIHPTDVWLYVHQSMVRTGSGFFCEQWPSLQQQRKRCLHSQKVSVLYRGHWLLGCGGHTWIPRADSVTGLRTRTWDPSRTRAMRLSCSCSPPSLPGPVATPGAVRWARVA